MSPAKMSTSSPSAFCSAIACDSPEIPLPMIAMLNRVMKNMWTSVCYWQTRRLLLPIDLDPSCCKHAIVVPWCLSTPRKSIEVYNHVRQHATWHRSRRLCILSTLCGLCDSCTRGQHWSFGLFRSPMKSVAIMILCQSRLAHSVDTLSSSQQTVGRLRIVFPVHSSPL